MADVPTSAAFLASLLLPTATQRPGVRYAWRGPSLLVVDEQGAAGTELLTGYYFRQARFQSHLQPRGGVRGLTRRVRAS